MDLDNKGKCRFRALSPDEKKGLRRKSGASRFQLEEIDSEFMGSLEEQTQKLNSEVVRDYVLETGVLPEVDDGTGRSFYERALERTMEQTKLLADDIAAVFVEGEHKEHYTRLEKAVAAFTSVFGSRSARTVRWLNERVENREYNQAMDWLSKHIAMFSAEEAKADAKYKEATYRVEALRSGILKDGYRLGLRKKGLDELEAKIRHSAPGRAKEAAKCDEGWNSDDIAYRTDLPKYQKEIIELEAAIQTKSRQISQEKATRMIAYKNYLLFVKSRVIFQEVNRRIDNLYEMSCVRDTDLPMLAVAQGVARFNPVQKRIDDITREYIDIADSLPDSVEDLIKVSDTLDEKTRYIFGSLAGTNSEQYRKAMATVSKVKKGVI